MCEQPLKGRLCGGDLTEANATDHRMMPRSCGSTLAHKLTEIHQGITLANVRVAWFSDAEFELSGGTESRNGFAMPSPSSMIKGPQQFQLLTESIACDMQTLSFHWRLYQDLQDAIENYESELNQSSTFWHLTFEAHLDASLFRLCRLYDQHQKTLNLKNWLVALRDNPALFDSSESCPCPSTLEVDIKSVSDRDDAVLKVVCLRNNAIAHRAVTPIVSFKAAAQHCTIPSKDVEKLVNRARELVNRYTSLLIRQSYSTTIVGHDDYSYVLDSVRERLQCLDES